MHAQRWPEWWRGRWLRLQSAAGVSAASEAVRRGVTLRDVALLLPLTLLAFLLLGYHPFAEDGGIYGAAIMHKLQPSLFPADAEWVEGHTRLSLFVPATAWVLQTLHVPLAWGLLLVQGAGLFAMLFSVWLLAKRCFQEPNAACWATVLVAVVAGLPIAGTAIYLVDPYVTARTVSTPLLLGAAACVLQRRWLGAACCWASACAVHPLMAAWGGLALAFLLVCRTGALLRQRMLWSGALCAAVLLLLAALGWLCSPASALTRLIALSRGYWFLSAWHWYEVVGLLAPLVLLPGGAALFSKPCRWTSDGRNLAVATWLAAMTGTAAALLFAHAGGPNFAVARLQPLRTLHFAYAVMLVLTGGSVYEAMHRLPARWRAGLMCTLVVAACIAMLLSQRALYRESGAIEWPWSTPQNGWAQAFLWIEQHTDVNDRVALDARYTESPGEDAQGFRAIARRSTLPDATKDAGIAAVVPALQTSWKDGVSAQTGLNSATDGERIMRLRPFHVQWLVLPAAVPTRLHCPYNNAAAKVCRLP